MSSLDDFLERLIPEGKILFRARPEPEAFGPGPAVDRLGRTFAAYRLDVAGAPIDFDARVAFGAAELVRQACWALINHDERVEGLGRRLTLGPPPDRASAHLSADLMLRYLPQILRRARSIDPSDPLVAILEDVLRAWPLSGVLAEMDEGPATRIDLGGHEGLMLLYAERLARHESPDWRPSGRAFEYVELVLRERGRDRSPLRVASTGEEDHG